MGTATLWGIIIVCIALIGLAVFLYRRGALTVDTEIARQELRDIEEDTARDIKNWRDKLDKKP